VSRASYFIPEQNWSERLALGIIAPEMLRLLIAIVAVAPFASALAAPAIGYAQSTNYYKRDSRPTLYQPLNLLDAREVTAWCTSGADPLEDQLTFGFKGSVKIDEVRIYTGNGFDETAFQEFSRAKKLSLKGPSGGHQLNLRDQRGFQSVQIRPALQGAQFSLEVLDQFAAEDPEAPVCLTDVVFYSDGKPLNGPWLTQKLKYDRQRAPLLGTWFAGYEGAPDRFLSFYIDGTYRYVYAPYDQPEKEKIFSGTYDVSGSRLVLQVPGKGKVSARMTRATAEDSETQHTLSLEGDLSADFNHTFRDFQ
jgi:hypothetical protein